MRQGLRIQSILLKTALLLVILVHGNVFATPAPHPIHENLSSLVQSASLIIVGQVKEIIRGRSVQEQEGILRFENVNIKVEKLLKGNAKETVIVEQLQPDGQIYPSEVGPPFKAGQRYLLFLRRTETGRYLPLTQGRYSLAQGFVRANEPGPVADKLDGIDEKALLDEISILALGR